MILSPGVTSECLAMFMRIIIIKNILPKKKIHETIKIKDLSKQWSDAKDIDSSRP